MEKLSRVGLEHVLSLGYEGLEQLRHYLQLNQKSKTPHIIFKPQYIEQTLKDYDIDLEIYKLILEDEKHRQLTNRVSSKKKIIIEGDSWLRLPNFATSFFPEAIGQQLSQKTDIEVTNIAHWGHTTEGILEKRQYMDAIHDDTNYFLFSAGCNDIQNHISDFFHDFDSNRKADEYITEHGKSLLKYIKEAYIKVFDEVTNNFPKIKILTYGYDYPQPWERGLYIGQYMHEKGIPDALMPEITNAAWHQLNMVIQLVSHQFPNSIYVNCLGSTENHDWVTDMHPSRSGYTVLANKLYEKMSPEPLVHNKLLSEHTEMNTNKVIPEQ